MGQRLLALDWAGHPLGDPAGWSAGIRAHVAAALASRFPTVLWLGEELRLVYNDAYIPMLGDKHPAALGSPGAQVWWDIWDVIAPMLRGVVRSGVATWSEDLPFAMVNEGRRRERYFTFTYSPIFGADGLVEGVFCAVTETTERVLGERRLQALSTLAAALLDVQAAGAILAAVIEVCEAHDADLPFAAIYATDAVLEPEARPEGPLAGARLHRATSSVAGLLPAVVAPLLDEASLGEDGVYLAALPAWIPGLRARFGERCPEQALAIPVGPAGGGERTAVLVLGLNSWRPLDDLYRGFCGLLADQVSAALARARAYEIERSRAEALAELDRAKTAFLTNVSHEFRTPLTLMLGPLEDLLGEASADGGNGGAERLEMIGRNGRRLLRLVNSLLDFSRIEAGRASPRLAVTDVGTLTLGVASSFADVCQMAGIGLVTGCQPAWALVDPAMWETIVLNLVSNAFKYTFAGSVTVRAGPAPAGGIELSVADTGTGVAAADLPYLFERFYRAASTSGRSTEGSGIGLALTKSLVEMQGGTIAVDSTLGRGTTVTVSLPPSALREPVREVGAGHAEPGAAARAYVDEAMQWLGARPDGGAAPAGLDHGRPAQARGQALVLVADDNADMRAHLARVLGSRWEVVTASGGRQALEMAGSLRPDLLVTDVMMPGLDGFALTSAIRADPGLAHLPVIMLTARAGVEAAGEGLAVGADDYLVKPFSSADLVNRVAARLEAAGRERALPDGLSARRDQEFAGLGAALAAARSVEQVLQALLAAPLCCLQAPVAAIGTLDESAGTLRVSYAGDVRAEIAGRYHLVDLDAPVPLADVVRADEPMIVTDTARLSPRYGRLVIDAVPSSRAAVMHPLHAGDGSVLGAVCLSWSRPRQFSAAEVDVTRRVCAMLARAISRIRAGEREHQIAMALQEHLLDLGTGVPAAVVAAAYQPAGEALRVGGDWYTATAVDASRTGVSVGDVAGHGLAAAAIMSQLRSALSTAALAGGGAAAVLALVDRYARTIPGAMFATAAYAIVDTAAGTVEYSCAGHPYPLIVTADGDTRYLREGRRPPLGAKSSVAGSGAGHARLAAGSLLLLYTDGLVERRDEPIDAGLARLAEAAARSAKLPADGACAALLRAMAGPEGYADDVAMVALRPCGTTAASHVGTLPAAFSEMAAARGRLGDWLRHVVPDAGQRGKILLCAGEAMANAIEHGSDRDPDRVVTVEAFAEPDTITVTVADTGGWAKDSPAGQAGHRGRGLTLIHGLADRVETARSSQGTRITIACRRTAADGNGRPAGTPPQ